MVQQGGFLAWQATACIQRRYPVYSTVPVNSISGAKQALGLAERVVNYIAELAAGFVPGMFLQAIFQFPDILIVLHKVFFIPQKHRGPA